MRSWHPQCVSLQNVEAFQRSAKHRYRSCVPLRPQVRAKEEQAGALQAQLLALERTRDALAEELVAAARAVEEGRVAAAEAARLRAEVQQARSGVWGF